MGGKRATNPLWVALPLFAIVLLLVSFAMARVGTSATDDAVTTPSPSASPLSAAQAKQASDTQDRWRAVDQIASAKTSLASTLQQAPPRRVAAASTVPKLLTDGQCPDSTVDPGVTHPNADQVTFRVSQSQGPSVTLNAGTATAASQCPVLTQLTNQAYVEVGSGVALCLQQNGSTSNLQNCDSAKDSIITRSAAIALPAPYQTVSVLDQANFLKQWNACPGCNLQRADLSGITLRSKANLTNADLSGTTIYNSSFSQANLTGAKFAVADNQPANFALSDFSNATVDSTTFDSSLFYKTDFSGADFACPQFINTVVSDIIFNASEWKPACASPQFSKSILNMDSIDIAIWPKLYLQGSTLYTNLKTFDIAAQKTLTNLRLVDSVFVGLPPKLTNTDFRGTTLDQSAFFLSNLSNAQFNSANTSLVDTDFAGTTMKSADFTNATAAAMFTDAYLVDTKFDHTTLTSNGNSASFQAASLAGISMTNASGTSVNFSDAYIWPGTKNPNFDGSTLRSSNFSGALLGNASFAGKTDLNQSDFAGAQCISCDLTDTKLDQSNFTSAYIYGTVFGGSTLTDANFTNAACCDASTWTYSVPTEAAAPNITYKDDAAHPLLSGGEFDDVSACPNGQAGQSGTGCKGENEPATPPVAQPACTSAGSFRCPQDISTIGGNGTAGYNDGGLEKKAKDAEFNNPSRLLLDSVQPRVIVSDTANHRLRAISGLSSQQPTIADFAGNGTAGSSGDDDAATSAELTTPMGLAQYPAQGPTDRAGAIVVADAGANNLRLINNGTIHALAGTGTACAAPTGSCGDGQNALDASLNAPQGVWIDPLGNAYVADTGDHKIRKIDFLTNIITTVAGTGSSTPGAGDPTTCQDGKPATSVPIGNPVDVSGDSMGNLYVVDQAASAVLKIDPRGCLTTFADSTNGLKAPTSVSIDRQDNIYVANSGANTVVSFSAWGIPEPVVGTGTAGFSGDSGASLSAQLNNAQGVASSTGGVLYLADTANQRIRLSQSPH